MRLFEHHDFEQLVLLAAEHFRPRGLRPAILEKDYYVTEALRIIAAAGEPIIFKGGTSLSKGWNLIDRFSEDIDIFLDPRAYDPPLGKRAIDRELKKLRDAVAEHPALTFVKDESQTIGGFGRNDRFSYHQLFGGPGEVANRVLLEAGTASGREPTTVIELRSYLSEFLAAQGLSMGADDEGPFPMRLLHFRRTFVEKMFAIHSKIEIFKRDGTPLGTYARHYYDLVKLAERGDVIAMLNSPEYAAIKADYDAISREYFPGSYFWPADMSFANSDALFPPEQLGGLIGPLSTKSSAGNCATAHIRHGLTSRPHSTDFAIFYSMRAGLAHVKLNAAFTMETALRHGKRTRSIEVCGLMRSTIQRPSRGESSWRWQGR